jgi:hypothetical protein
MQLIHRAIPREFVERLPEGMKFIHRHGKEFLVVEELLCPKGHSLMVDSVRIHDEPSISIAVERPEGPGLIFIDAYWGSHAKLFNFMADPRHPMHYADAHCPHCGTSLVVERSCGRIDCDSNKSLAFHLPGDENNLIYVCAKLGCPDHSIMVEDLSPRVQEEVSRINFFGYGDDDDAFGGI